MRLFRSILSVGALLFIFAISASNAMASSSCGVVKNGSICSCMPPTGGSCSSYTEDGYESGSVTKASCKDKDGVEVEKCFTTESGCKCKEIEQRAGDLEPLEEELLLMFK